MRTHASSGTNRQYRVRYECDEEDLIGVVERNETHERATTPPAVDARSSTEPAVMPLT